MVFQCGYEDYIDITFPADLAVSMVASLANTLVTANNVVTSSMLAAEVLIRGTLVHILKLYTRVALHFR